MDVVSGGGTAETHDAVGVQVRVAFGVLGGVALLAGIAALVLPHATLFAVVWVFGIYLAVAGISLLVRAGADRGRSGWIRSGTAVVGIVVIACGVFAILQPSVGVRWVAYAIGFAWILEGIALLYAPVEGNRVLVVLGAVLSVLSGVVVINVPALGAVVAVVTVGIVLIVSGLVQLGIAITWGRAHRTIDTERTPT